jgi:hypothetical protein
MRLFPATVTALVLAAGLGAARPVPGPQQPPQQVLDRVAEYVERYGADMSLVIGIEHYAQTERETNVVRTLVSEIALVKVDGDWLGYRDVMEVDGKPITDRSTRLRTLFLASPATAIEQGRRIADESARYNLGGVLRNFNMPTMALLFLQKSNRHRFRFSHSATEARIGSASWKFEFEEVARPTIIRTSAGKPMPVKGHVWVLPEKGTVVETEMAIEATSMVLVTNSRASAGQPGQAGEFKPVPSRARITVSYIRDRWLDLMVPAEMREEYERVGLARRPGDTYTDATLRTECRATYTDFKRFETSAALKLPK